MAADIPTIAGWISTVLTNAGIRNAAYLKDNPNPPMALVAIGDVEYHNTAANATAAHDFRIYLILSRASDRAGYEAMEAYMSNTGSTSIRNILEGADNNLGQAEGTVQIVVNKAQEPRAITINGNPYMGVIFECTVYG